MSSLCLGIGLASVLTVSGCGRINYDPLAGEGDAGNAGSDGGNVARVDANPGEVCTLGTINLCSDVTSGVFLPGSGSYGNANGGQFGDYSSGSCGGDGSGDYGVTLRFLSSGTYTLTNTSSYASVLYVFDALTGTDGCDGVELACEDIPGAAGESVTLTATTGDEIIAIVDAEAGQCGSARIELTSN